MSGTSPKDRPDKGGSSRSKLQTVRLSGSMEHTRSVAKTSPSTLYYPFIHYPFILFNLSSSLVIYPANQIISQGSGAMKWNAHREENPEGSGATPLPAGRPVSLCHFLSSGDRTGRMSLSDTTQEIMWN